jgi:GntR family transcriptional regulator
MDSNLPVRQSSLASQILDILVGRIQDGSYLPQTQFPPENQLAKEFDVSRATIRSAMDRLESRGLIIRRQGVGTFISQLSGISNPINQFIEFSDLMIAHGAQMGSRLLRVSIEDASVEIAAALRLGSDRRILRDERIFTADGEDLIYCLNHVPVHVFQDHIPMEEILEFGLEGPYFDFFEKRCKRRIEYFISSVQPVVAASLTIPKMAYMEEENAAVLVIDEIGFDADEIPIGHAVEYLPGNRMKFELIRYRESR